MKITVNGKEVDTDKALPLQLRDLRRLKREFKIDLVEGLSGDVERQFGFLLVLFQKANKDITEEDVESLTLPQTRDAIVAGFAVDESPPDVPPSASSTK